MKVYRIAKCKYANDLSGTGARYGGGRWNSIGTALLYTSENSALAAFELMTHVSLSQLPTDLCIATINIPDSLEIHELTELPDYWDSIPPSNASKLLGDEFVHEGKLAVLKVPSVVIKGGYNYLINPLHLDHQQIKIDSIEPFSFDERLQQP